LNEKEYETENFKKTNWKQTSDIIVSGEVEGILEVYYLEEKPVIDKGPFLKEEKSLIDSIAKRLGNTIERMRAEEVEKRLESQLQQAQKMEAIGVLAGGVAHDFNNILTTIIGNAHMALMKVGKDSPLREEIEEIKIAGERAASLTRQLLSFSRKQIIQPKVVDLNELLTDIEKMLGRLIGEDVELLTIPDPELWQVEVDPGQMEQVIMNLTINAKDAMPMGGKLTIETANMNLKESYFHEHGIESQPGFYVMLAVSDTGSGMDKETQERIFEPFYTTKGIGKGTGLGLSTVHGIVKQSKGFIWVYSELGKGSTFKAYFPMVKEDVDAKEKERTPVTELGGTETVLLVEDDDSLRKLARTVLKQRGYKVLEAENGEDALSVSEAHDGPIALMITDVVMPKMSGKETVERLQPLYPQMKVIYMSGYTDNAIVHHGVLAPGLNFLEKPFSPEDLARKVREVLDKKD
jgi:signal transduction histidine kinase/CheY-like chemotaxis protein